MTKLKRLERAQARWGPYALQRQITEDTWSVSFLAYRDDAGGTAPPCIVTVPRPEIAAAEGFGQALDDAASAARRLEHTNLLRVIDHGRADDGEPYLVTEHVAGSPLRHLQAVLHAEGKRLPPPCVVTVGLCIASALHRLDAGIDGTPLIHGDISLDRIHVSTTGEVKLQDACFATAVRATRGPRPPVSGHLAVEQLLGAPMDGRTDQYALAAVLYELATGEAPYARDHVAATVAAILGGHRQDRHGANPPQDLMAIVDRALARRPEARFEAAATMYTELERVAARMDVTSAVGLLASLAQSFQSPSPAASPDPVGDRPAPVAPIRAAAFAPIEVLPGLAPLPEAPASEGESVMTVVWAALVTATVIVSIFVWAWVLGR